jgi:hypothetical protein
MLYLKLSHLGGLGRNTEHLKLAGSMTEFRTQNPPSAKNNTQPFNDGFR